MKAAADEIETLYKKNFIAWVNEAKSKIDELGVEYVIKEGAKALGGIPQYLLMDVQGLELGIQLTGELTGHKESAKGVYDFSVYNSIFSSSVSAYTSSLAKLKAADPSDPSYSILAEDTRNCFNVAKQSGVKMFESMEKAANDNPERRAYYGYCRHQMEQAGMFDSGPLDLLSFEEYITAYGS